MDRRTIIGTSIAMLAVLGAGVGVGVALVRRARHVTEARVQRTTPILEVAPAAITDATPLLAGTEGVDADGYPTQYVDPIVVRGYLLRKRFDDLTRAFEAYEDAAEKDERHEYWIIDAGSAFDSAEPALGEELDAWVAASPNSFAPYFARGVHAIATGYALRGANWASETPEADLKAMGKSFEPATEDLVHALSIRPRLVAAKRQQIRIAGAIGSRRDVRRIADEATTICPGCFQVRVTYLHYSSPRWGGSFLEMAAYAKGAASAPNPKTRFLPGYVDAEKSAVALLAKDAPGALAAANAACALGDHWDFLEARAEAFEGTKDWSAAKKDLDRAIALRPKVAQFLVERANVEIGTQEYEAAARDLLDGVRIEPTSRRASEIFEPVVGDATYQGWQDRQRQGCAPHSRSRGRARARER